MLKLLLLMHVEREQCRDTDAGTGLNGGAEMHLQIEHCS